MDERPRIDGTARDYESLRTAMLALARDRLPEWTDQSANDPGVLLVELFAAMGDAIFYHQDRIAAESYLGTAVERRSVLHLLRLIGYELRPPVPATADLTLFFPAGTTAAPVKQGDRFETPAAVTGKAITFEYVGENLALTAADLASVKIGNKDYLAYRTLPVVQVSDSASNEPLGTSDGSPGQRYSLAKAPLIASSLVVTVDEGAPRAWIRRDTLEESGPASRDYRVRYDENDVAFLEFGDGRRGMAPPRGAAIVAASYRTGGGAAGNVRAGAITVFKGSRNTGEVAPALVTNERPATGGADREPIDEAARRAPIQFRAAGRAVTASDYEAHALAFGVAKARARAVTWNRIQLTVAPRGGGLPSLTLKEQVRAYFEPRRVLTSIIEVIDPEYVALEIAVDVAVEPYYDRNQIRRRTEDAIRELYAFERTDFGDALYLSKLYEAIEAVVGVAHANVRVFRKLHDAAPISPDGVIRLADNQLAVVRPAPDPSLVLTATGGR